MNKFKKGDKVIVITGKHKGVRGKLSKILKNNTFAIVENVNMVKKCVKRNKEMNEEGGIIEVEAPIHISNLAIENPQTSKPDRVGFKKLEDGRKVRYLKSNNEILDA